MPRWWIREQSDNRPVICYCAECGEPIHGENINYFGDVYYEIESDRVHEDCVMDYLDRNCKRGG